MNKTILKAIVLFLLILGTPVILPLRTVDGVPPTYETVVITVETPVTEPPEVPDTTETAPVIDTEPTEIPTEVTEPEFVSYYEYTEEELDLLARLVYSEGGGESYETQLRIASVVMNRVEDPKFPNTIREVIYQKNQFSVTTIKINGVIMIDRPASEESYRAAKEILDYGSILPSTVQVFYAVYCKEPWVTSREIYEICDNTVFAHIYRRK